MKEISTLILISKKVKKDTHWLTIFLIYIVPRCKWVVCKMRAFTCTCIGFCLLVMTHFFLNKDCKVK